MHAPNCPTQHKADIIAFALKNGMIGAFWLIFTPQLNAIVNYDPRRTAQPFQYWSYETPAAARTRFDEFLAQTRDNGWLISYHGPRNFG